MKMTPEQLYAHNQRRLARLERIAPHFMFYRWSGDGWLPSDVVAWWYDRLCARARIQLANSEGRRATDDRVCMRVSIRAVFIPFQKGAAA